MKVVVELQILKLGRARDVHASTVSRLDLKRTGSVGEPSAHRSGPCENSDEEMGLSRLRPVGGLRLRGATDDGPPPLLPSTRRGLYD